MIGLTQAFCPPRAEHVRGSDITGAAGDFLALRDVFS